MLCGQLHASSDVSQQGCFDRNGTEALVAVIYPGSSGVITADWGEWERASTLAEHTTLLFVLLEEQTRNSNN